MTRANAQRMFKVGDTVVLKGIRSPLMLVTDVGPLDLTPVLNADQVCLAWFDKSDHIATCRMNSTFLKRVAS